MLGISRAGRAGRTRRAGPAAGAAIVIAALLSGLAVPAQAGPAGDESLLLTLTNTVRAGLGIPALSLDSTLSSIARQWAGVMASQGNISHNPNMKAQIEAAGFSNWSKTGENVGMGPTVQAIQQALVNSPGHYRNITDGDFQKVGIGVVYGGNTVWVVVDFLMLNGAPAPAPAPPPAPAPAPAPVYTPDPTPPPAPVVQAPPPPPPTTTPPATTTTVPPTTTTTTLPAPPPSGLPMQLALMVQQLRALSAHR